jgi:hypothetical protein
LQKRAFRSLLLSNGCDLKKIAQGKPIYKANYEKLEKDAAKDSNALVIGLRSLSPKGLKVVPLNGVSITDPKAGDKYILKVPVYVYTNITRKGASAARDKWAKMVQTNIANSKNSLKPLPKKKGQKP